MEKNMLAGMEEMLSEDKTTKSDRWVRVVTDAAKAEQIEKELGEIIDPDILSIIDDLNPIDPETAAILDNIDLEDIIDEKSQYYKDLNEIQS